MGQYYKPIVLAKKRGRFEKILAWVYSHDIKFTFKRQDGASCTIGHGLKLMEHSWRKNDFVQAFETLIADNPQRVVWAGDYADNEFGRKETYISERKDELGRIVKKRVKEDVNLYGLCKDDTKRIPKARAKEYRFVINHTKGVFVDKRKGAKDNDGWQIHPLPLLTCEGNGRGGGDFRGDNSLIGAWARDVISVSDTKPKDFEELIFDLVE